MRLMAPQDREMSMSWLSRANIPNRAATDVVPHLRHYTADLVSPIVSIASHSDNSNAVAK